MAVRETVAEQSGTTKPADLPARRVEDAKATQVKGGAKRPLQPCL